MLHCWGHRLPTKLIYPLERKSLEPAVEQTSNPSLSKRWSLANLAKGHGPREFCCCPLCGIEGFLAAFHRSAQVESHLRCLCLGRLLTMTLASIIFGLRGDIAWQPCSIRGAKILDLPCSCDPNSDRAINNNTCSRPTSSSKSEG